MLATTANMQINHDIRCVSQCISAMMTIDNTEKACRPVGIPIFVYWKTDWTYTKHLHSLTKLTAMLHTDHWATVAPYSKNSPSHTCLALVRQAHFYLGVFGRNFFKKKKTKRKALCLPVGMHRCRTGVLSYTGNGGHGPKKSKNFKSLRSASSNKLISKS